MALIKIRRDTSANWASANPVLSDGEIGYDKTINKIKIGNGVSAFNALSFLLADASISSGDVTTALGFTPYNATNPNGYITSINSAAVTTALGYTPTSITGLTGVQSVAALKTGLSLTKADVGLSNVDNTADASKNVLAAATLTTPRNINGVAFDGSADISINAVDSTARVPTTRTISTTAPLTGGGDLSADRTLAISAATTSDPGTMSAADKTKLNAITGTNTGDQTSIVGITGTKAQFDTAVTDGNILYVGDVTQYTDELAQDAVGGMIDSSLVYVDGTPLLQRAALTGAVTASAGSNTTALGSFTAAQLNTAVSDADLATLGANSFSGNQTVTGNVSVTDDPFAAGWNSSTNVPTKNAIYDGVVGLLSAYRTILDASGSHVAAKVAGTYGFGQGDPLAISGTGTLYPLNVMYIDPNDYPAVAGLTAKMRIRCSLSVNDTAPTGNFTVALHPITRPASSGGAALLIYTIGAAVASSGVTVNTPAADSTNQLVGSDFAVPTAGHYVIGLVSTATVAASSHLHLSAHLQLRYS